MWREVEGPIMDPENEFDATEMRKYLGLGGSGPLELASLGTSMPLSWSRYNASILICWGFLIPFFNLPEFY
jgi:hypothetical protein